MKGSSSMNETNLSPAVIELHEPTADVDIDPTRLIRLAVDIAENMLACGSEVSRIEESVTRICNSYGATKCDVFCITSVIIVTGIWKNQEVITQSRRISQGARNFNKLEMLNSLSRDICEKKTPLDEVEERLKKISERKHYSKRILLIGSILAASSFTVFFGGTFLDALAAMICGVAVFLVEQFVYDRRMNKVVYNIVCSFMAGLIAVFLVWVGIGKSLDKIMIGCIMLLIPGLNFTAAVEDILVGDTATGALRIFEAVLTACAIALGFALAVYFSGGSVSI